MFIRQLDYLSPSITFYHKGFLSHSSIVSGIISIISFAIIICLAIYFSLDVINRQNPTTFYCSGYIEDSGIFPMNSSSLFHYISLSGSTDDYKNNGINFKDFRIIGLENEYYYYSMNDLENYNHWIYGPCDKQKNAKDIDESFLQNFFEKSACITKYFDKEKQKYFDIDDSEFRWPTMAHGASNSNSIFYTIVLEKCKKSTLDLILGEGYECSNDDELNKTIGEDLAASLFFVNNYVDIFNYKNPDIKIIHQIENKIQMTKYPVNFLYFNPFLIKTNDGLILDKFEEKKSKNHILMKAIIHLLMILLIMEFLRFIIFG